MAQILADTCSVATALRTAAERQETAIYTHYEGWLPDEEELPTNLWRAAWCDLLHDSRPAARLADPAPTAGFNDPPVDLSDPTVAARVTARSQQPSY